MITTREEICVLLEGCIPSKCILCDFTYLVCLDNINLFQINICCCKANYNIQDAAQKREIFRTGDGMGNMR
jgi:hypothetical protein